MTLDLNLDLDYYVFAAMVCGLAMAAIGYLVGVGHCWYRMSGKRSSHG